LSDNMETTYPVSKYECLEQYNITVLSMFYIYARLNMYEHLSRCIDEPYKHFSNDKLFNVAVIYIMSDPAHEIGNEFLKVYCEREKDFSALCIFAKSLVANTKDFNSFDWVYGLINNTNPSNEIKSKIDMLKGVMILKCYGHDIAQLKKAKKFFKNATELDLNNYLSFYHLSRVYAFMRK
ncbi:MAG: hypothetical protein MHPSP_003133, partial [Paramarteilia canceri]